MTKRITDEYESTRIDKGDDIKYYTAFIGYEEYRDLPYNPKLIEHNKSLGFDTAIEVIKVGGILLFSGDRYVAETLLMEDTYNDSESGAYVCEEMGKEWDASVYIKNRLAEIEAEIVNFTDKEIYG